MSHKLYGISWTKNQLWEGCILASIAHAIMVAHYPDFSHEHSWDGINYNVQDSEGARGTITFHPQYCIAAFRDDNSERITKGNFRESFEYFKDAPKEIINLSKIETLQYLLDNVDQKKVPLITSALWTMGNTLVSIDTFDDMINNGGFLLEIQTMDYKAAIKAWKEYYEMSAQQCKLLESIYERKISKSTDTLILSKNDICLIGSNDPDGLDESETSFQEIDIHWEK